MLTTAIKRARHMALLPYVKDENLIYKYWLNPVGQGLWGYYLTFEFLGKDRKKDIIIILH